MFLLYLVLFCNFAISSQICKTFLGLISCKCCNIVFCLSLLYAVIIFPPCKCKYCHKQTCSEINVIKKRSFEKVSSSVSGLPQISSAVESRNKFRSWKIFLQCFRSTIVSRSLHEELA